MKLAERYRGSAPETARSLTVPLTASSPIDPPGKNRGCTTNESVLIANRAEFTPGPPTSSTAASPRFSRAGLRKAGRNRCSTNSLPSLPPPPWPITMVGYPTSGSGQDQLEKSGTDLDGSFTPALAFSAIQHPRQPRSGTRQLFSRNKPPIVVISGAGALAGNHRRTKRMPRRAFFSECRTLRRLDDPAQNISRKTES